VQRHSIQKIFFFHTWNPGALGKTNPIFYFLRFLTLLVSHFLYLYFIFFKAWTFHYVTNGKIINFSNIFVNWRTGMQINFYNAPLILKMRDNIFVMQEKYLLGPFRIFIEKLETFWTLKMVPSAARNHYGVKKVKSS